MFPLYFCPILINRQKVENRLAAYEQEDRNRDELLKADTKTEGGVHLQLEKPKKVIIKKKN